MTPANVDEWLQAASAVRYDDEILYRNAGVYGNPTIDRGPLIEDLNIFEVERKRVLGLEIEPKAKEVSIRDFVTRTNGRW